jgi:hypothetical protein
MTVSDIAFLPVDFAEDDVGRPDDGHEVPDEVALGHLRQGL